MERIYRTDYIGMEQVELLLKSENLKLDKHLDEIYILYDDFHNAIATGSIYNNVLKCIAVSEEYKGSNTINKVISFLINKCYENNKTHLFIYTKPDSYKSFEYFAFKKIAETENVVLMENDKEGLDNYLRLISKDKVSGNKISSIVLNCNPFTLGHKYLVEKASKESDWLHIFLVWEDNSTFPNEVRYDLVCKGLSEYKNISIHKGMHYIISDATFPSYFLGDDKEVVKEQTTLDLKLFSESIASVLNITHRYVGKEPFNETTSMYNKRMKEILIKYDIEVIEIDRKESKVGIISASTVRQMLVENRYDVIRQLVPESTYEYLLSDDSNLIIDNLIKNYDKKKLV